MRDCHAVWAAADNADSGELPGACKFDMICELDAAVALLYGLDEKDVRHVFEAFHEGWVPVQTATHPTFGDYDARLKPTLGHFGAWKKEA